MVTSAHGAGSVDLTGMIAGRREVGMCPVKIKLEVSTEKQEMILQMPRGRGKAVSHCGQGVEIPTVAALRDLED